MKNKKQHLPKGFLSMNGEPTHNSIMMFMIYLLHLPTDWNKDEVNLPSVGKVRDHFGVDYGFENMIRWGIKHSCCKSKTSSGRHSSMSKSYILAQGVIGSGVILGRSL